MLPPLASPKPTRFLPGLARRSRFLTEVLATPAVSLPLSIIIWLFLTICHGPFPQPVEKHGSDSLMDCWHAPVRCLVKVGNTGLKILLAAGRMEIRFPKSSVNAQSNSIGVPRQLSLKKGNKPQIPRDQLG